MLIYHKNWYIVNEERVKFYNEDRKEIISKYYKDRRNACKKIEEKIEIKPRNICKFGF